jgi:Zn-dependent protease with chaperone function
MKRAVCETILYLPDEIIKHVTRKVWFISSPEDAWAFTFRGSDIKGQHLIVISDKLLRQTANDISYTILHEIGHVMLRHRNSMGFEQSKEEIRRQEKEADKFAKKYLS